MTGDDRAAFLATVDRRQRTYYQRQVTLFARMRTVPFKAFAYRLDPKDLRPAGKLRRHYRAEQVQQAPVQVRYRFEGQDASPVLARESFTFVLTGSGWRIAGPGDSRMRRRDDVEIWDSGAVRTARSARTLIVHHPGQEALARRLLRVADRAYAQVGAAWTGRWERKAVILVPRDQDEAEQLVGARDLSRVAAVASSSVESGSAEPVLGNRIVVNTDNVVRYNDLNLQILITHEMTHVATRTLGAGVPLLLVEGFADWAALKPVGFSFASTRPALNQRVDSGRFDGRLPADQRVPRPRRRGRLRRGLGVLPVGCHHLRRRQAPGALPRVPPGPARRARPSSTGASGTSSASPARPPSAAGRPGSATSC